MIDADYTGDRALLENTPTQDESLQPKMEQAARDIGHNVNSDKKEFMHFHHQMANPEIRGPFHIPR